MKLKMGDSVFVWYLESILSGVALPVAKPFYPMDESHLNDNCTIISEKVFKSDLFQTLLEDKINGLY